MGPGFRRDSGSRSCQSPRASREAKRDQEQVVDFPRSQLWKTGDNRSGQAARQRLQAQARLPAQGSSHVCSWYVHVNVGRLKRVRQNRQGTGGDPLQSCDADEGQVADRYL
jgi:hypothetical protein